MQHWPFIRPCHDPRSIPSEVLEPIAIHFQTIAAGQQCKPGKPRLIGERVHFNAGRDIDDVDGSVRYGRTARVSDDARNYEKLPRRDPVLSPPGRSCRADRLPFHAQ